MLRTAICCIFAAISAQAATPLFQASFDTPSQGWTVLRGAAVPDGSVLRAGNKSLRIDAVKTSADACVRSAPVALTIGKRYELTGWVRTDSLTVNDLDRSPIAVGAALTMASMPFDVHSAAVGGPRDWSRLTLRFVASRAQDNILLTVGNGGRFNGTAWFEGVSL